MGAALRPVRGGASRLQEEMPDVITLDVEMPRMDGITFLRKIMSQRPIPVVMCSSLTEAGSETLMQALEAGAVDVILKPKIAAADHLAEIRRSRIREVVKAAAVKPALGAVRRGYSASVLGTTEKKLTADAVLPPPSGRAMAKTTENGRLHRRIDRRDGGAAAVCLKQLPANAPGIVIVQHMPEKFTAAFAQAAQRALCEVEVREAVTRRPRAARPRADRAGRSTYDAGAAGRALPGLGTRRSARLAPPAVRRRAVPLRGAIGGSQRHGHHHDGHGRRRRARHWRRCTRPARYTVAQDEASSIVFGMPKEAIAHGGVDRILPLDQIAREILAADRRR
jgi:two-component system chemotaxis response regulator CheB